MDIISAVKRLERAGDENSRATEKLHEAARIAARLIIDSVPRNLNLPRGYKVIRTKSNVGAASYLYWGKDQYGDWERCIDGPGGYLHGDFHCEMPSQTRAGSLEFAKDVAEGLLDEIAEFLEKRKEESESATSTLEVAAVAQIKGE